MLAALGLYVITVVLCGTRNAYTLLPIAVVDQRGQGQLPLPLFLALRDTKSSTQKNWKRCSQSRIVHLTHVLTVLEISRPFVEFERTPI